MTKVRVLCLAVAALVLCGFSSSLAGPFVASASASNLAADECVKNAVGLCSSPEGTTETCVKNGAGLCAAPDASVGSCTLNSIGVCVESGAGGSGGTAGSGTATGSGSGTSGGTNTAPTTFPTYDISKLQQNAPAVQLPGTALIEMQVLVGYLKWGGLVAGVIGMIICGLMMMLGRRGRSQTAVEGASGIPAILGGLTVISLAASLVGAITSITT